MKKLIAFALVAMLSVTTTGCLSIGSNNSKSTTTATTTMATTQKTMTTSSTTQSNREPAIVKRQVEEPIETQTTLSFDGLKATGFLSFEKTGFVFTPDEGEEMKFPLNSILLAVTDMPSSGETEELVLCTDRYEFAFTVEKGYAQKLSKYLLISVKSAE